MSTKKSAIIFLVVAFVIVIIITLMANSSGSTPAASTTSAGSETTNPNASIPTTPTTPSTPTTPATPVTAGSYTLSQVAKHSTRADCWTTINGGVYNVTSWIDQHPGGADAIISLCGIDGSDAFNGQHGGQRRPATELATFKIGTLAQ